MAKKLTQEEFLKKSHIIHGDKYDYSCTKYINSRSKIKIICKKHGIFEQLANDHLQGGGCLKCRDEKFSVDKKKTTEQFIKEAQLIHNNKYDYSLVKYNQNNENVIIICKKHGEFMQTPITHLSGYGCSKCSKCKKLTQEEFIERCISIHGNKYDYSVTKYINKRTKVNIRCILHGIFVQSPSNHIHGRTHGCPICRESKGEKNIVQILDSYQINYERQKRFADCKNKKTLSFDFYLPKFNVCIEYDGEQHFKPIKYWGGEKNFLSVQTNDMIKNIYCVNKGIDLIRIRFDHDIESELIPVLSLLTSIT